MVSLLGWRDPNYLGMLLELRKAREITRLRLVLSRASLNSRNIPACLDQAIQTRKP
jgi:hypothetical protein